MPVFEASGSARPVSATGPAVGIAGTVPATGSLVGQLGVL